MPLSNILTSKLDSYMIKALTEEASRIAEKAKGNASWSSRIPNAISVGQAEKTSTGFQIEIKIDSTEDGPAPHAEAFEYGSGEHATKGEKGKYIISPKEATALAFDWTPDTVPWGSPKFFGAILESKDSTKGRYFFHFVEHPGVEAKPYMQPAVESGKGNLFNKIGSAFRNAYRDSVVKVTVISA